MAASSVMCLAALLASLAFGPARAEAAGKPQAGEPQGEGPRLVNERQVFPADDRTWQLSETTHWPMMRLSPDGRRLLYLRHVRGEGEAAEYALTLRDLENGRDLRVPVPPVAAEFANIYPRIDPFNKDGKQLVLTLFDHNGEGGNVRSRVVLWTVGEKEPVETGLGGPFWLAKFDRTGKRLIVNQGRTLATAAAPDFEPRPLGVSAVLWTSCPTANVLAVYGFRGGGREPSLFLHEVQAGEEVGELPLEGRGSRLDDLETVWTTNGRYLCYADTAGVQVWDRQAGRLAVTLKGEAIGDGYPVGPGPTPTTVLIKRLPEVVQLPHDPKERARSEGMLVLHDAASGGTWRLGPPGAELQDARGGKAVYLRHHEDGSATVHVADVVGVPAGQQEE